MSITVPAAGDPIIDSWGVDVATQLNRATVLSSTSDVTTTSGSFVTTGLSLPVVSGTNYHIALSGWYSVANVNTGIGFAFHLTTATGTTRLMLQFASSAVATISREWLITADTGTGSSTTDTTNVHWWSVDGIFQCTASGTWSLYYNRNGTSSNVVISKGSGGTIIASA